MIDICPSRDDAQPHIVKNNRCVLCKKSVVSDGKGPCVKCGKLTSVGPWGYINEWTDSQMVGSTYIPGTQVRRKTFHCGC